MQIKLLKSKIHRATVTNSDLNYQGSIAVDQNLLEAATIRPFESVHVWNVTNGNRLETYALPASPGSGEICLNGAAARKATTGDVIIIASFAWVPDTEISGDYSPRIIFVDEKNRITPAK
jgi:aspartate 1-decarboxylase